MTTRTDAAYADQLDIQDTLAHFRERFVFTDPDLIYLDGNSLGRLPKASAQLAETIVHQQWGDRLIRSWGERWFTSPEHIGAKIARLIGAQPDEVIVADSTSVNLFKLVVAALQQQQGRTHILTDNLNFPSDLYILQGAVDVLGQQHQLEIIPSPDNVYGPTSELHTRLDEQTALLTLSHTVFKSGYIYDMAEMTAAAHAAGAMVLWDLCHSVGAVPVDLNAVGADLAIGCTYKYLNSGPGAPAFLYIRRDLQEKLLNPISGWWGQKNPFGFDLNYQPASGLNRFLTGTTPILSMLLIEPGVDLIMEAGLDNLRAKSIQQGDYLIGLWEVLLEPLGFQLNSPREGHLRGAHVSLGHIEGPRIDLTMIHDMKVIPDFRPPDNIRLGLAPIYTSFKDIHTAVTRMQKIVTDRLYEKYDAETHVII